MEIKQNAVKAATSTAMSLAGYYTFVLADKIADRLDIPATNLESIMGRFGEGGLDAIVRYGLPVLVILGYRKLAENIEDYFSYFR